MRFGYRHGLEAFRRAKRKLVNIKRPSAGRQCDALHVLEFRLGPAAAARQRHDLQANGMPEQLDLGLTPGVTSH